ncbi:O-antigen ligase family protein [Photobacterium sp.]|uniref:O-antigen ligase family protein n=1 Tax=Photobacterium sp. TaxID=660 RepID=UPI00299CF437|nr:O-antigen ligase family protein [Photobacterium sp.]MDX1302643.1 O-antigen ligase family protein [Photobacterium sp.]
MNKKAITHFLILLPFIWLFSGMLVMRSGDKPMIAMIVISIIATLISHGLDSIKENLKRDKTLWVVLITTGYALFSYHYHGLSSREIRSLLGASLLLLCFPRHLLTPRLLQGLTLIGAIACAGFAIYYSQVAELIRSNWPINAIPQATLSASIGIIALAQVMKHSNRTELVLSIISLIFSLTAIIFSQTRGIWLGFGIASGLMLLLHFRSKQINWKFITVGLAMTFTAGFALKPQLEQRIEQTQHEAKQIIAGNLNTSIGLRLQMWQLSPYLLSNDWLLGTGDSQSDKFQSLYKKELVSETLYRFKPAHYHNQYLDRLIKNGVIGLALMLLILVVPLTQLNKQPSSKRYKIIGLVVLFAIAALTDVPLNHGQTLFMYLLLVCGLATYSSKAEEN